MSVDFVLRGSRVLVDGAERPATLLVVQGRIARILPFDASPDGYSGPIHDVGAAAVLPGFVDTHVHVNEPGRTEWEGFETATRAAAAGGITTLVDMPLNCLPVTTTAEALKLKIQALGRQPMVDLGFWGGLIPDNARDLAPLLDAGVLGVKAFMVHSGIDEFPNVTQNDLRAAMPLLAERNIPLLLHAELDLGLHEPSGDPRRYGTYLASRPPAMEVEAVRMAIRLCREFRGPVHIVHLSAADALPDIASARADGLPLTVETCPHYLTFTAETVPDGATAYKCAPPIRPAENRERLWNGLRTGVIDFVVCDHSPCTPQLKKPEQGDFMGAWGGISSVQFAPAIVWTEASKRGFWLTDLARWLAERPARFAGLGNRKGRIAVGFDADLVVWDPDAAFTVQPDRILHRHPVTPYVGATLKGVALETYLRGRLVYDRGAFPARATGQGLLRQALTTA